VKGRRLPDDFTNTPGFTWEKVEPGDYFKKADGRSWFVQSPAGDAGTVTPEIWTIIELSDGTITVAPSIWFNKPTGWHGYLEAGVWRQVS
jgi:hypothetical protein